MVPQNKRAKKSYPKPGNAGGTLLRQIHALLFKSPKSPFYPSSPIKDAHILIACSGGIDSVALAVALSKYGRRIVAKEALELLHIDHGWRGAVSESDSRFVSQLGDDLGIPVIQEKLTPKVFEKKGESQENLARMQRKKLYQKWVCRKEAELGKKTFVLTAHHADDVFETLLWRIFTGALLHESEGIQLCTGHELRPLIRVEKKTLIEFLSEESQSYCEDQTNQDTRFLRNGIRHRLVPEILALFPNAKRRLMELTKQLDEHRDDLKLPKIAQELMGRQVPLRKDQIKLIRNEKAVTLSGGWQLTPPQKTLGKSNRVDRSS